MNVRQIQTLLKLVSSALFVLAGLVGAGIFAGVGAPAHQEPQRAAIVQQTDEMGEIYRDYPKFERHFESVWMTRAGEAKKAEERRPDVRPVARATDPASELRSLVIVVWARGGQVYMRWPGQPRETLVSEGATIQMAGGQPLEILGMEKTDPLYKSGVVKFRYRAVEVDIPWSQLQSSGGGGGGGTAVPEDFGQRPDYERPPEEDPGPEGWPGEQPPGDPAYREVATSRQLRPNHWQVAPEEWRDIYENFESHVAEVAPTVIYDKSSGQIRGLKLSEVPQGSLAWQRGFREGDIVQRVNGELVTSTDDLKRLMEKYASSNRGVVQVDRFGKVVSMIFELAQ